MKTEKKLKELLGNKRERAKVELLIYGIFFLILIIFIRISSFMNNGVSTNKEILFTDSINDNYAYTMEIYIDNNKYNYYGKRLGHNGYIVKDNIKYYIINDKFYILEEDNYILTDINDIIDGNLYDYIKIDKIKEYIYKSTKENGHYTTDNIIIDIDNNDKSVIIDYSSLFNEYDSVIVKINYKDIDKIISLDE